MARKTISRAEAANFLSVSIKTIDRWIRDGRIENYKPHGSSRVLIYLDSLTQENLQSAKPKFLNS